MRNPWIAACEREQIHTPGATQRWGALLIVDANSLTVSHASANLEDFIDFPAADSIGRPLAEVLDPEISMVLVAGGTTKPPPGALATIGHTASGRAYAASSHQLNRATYIEIEPAPDDGSSDAWVGARRGVEALRTAPDLRSLFAAAASEIRRATGFDRAMVYRFDAVGDGEVVAEDCASDLEPFLGLHYPASDVPRQARRLYLRQRVRVIEDVQAPAVPLLHAANAQDSPDLSLSALRAASPVHLEYLRNMGVGASLAVSLTVDGTLWGLLVCHHRDPRLTPAAKRSVAGLIGQVASSMIGTLRDAETRAETAMQRARVADLSGRLAQTHEGVASLLETLAANGQVLMALCEAPGVIVRLGGSTVSLGSAPAGPASIHLLDTLLATAPESGEAFATVETGSLLTSGWTETVREQAAGALVVPIVHSMGDCIAWVRPEKAHTVRWGGDPSAQMDGDAVSGALSPRRSFAVWKQEVRGQSTAWSATQIEAAQALRRAIEYALVRCAEVELMRLRQHDSLTGLPNRLMMRERLEIWSREQLNLCLLIVEIDRFKALNEALGERLGDTVLIEAGKRIANAAASSAMVARIASFAFGVFGHSIEAVSADSLAETLLAAMAEPFLLDGKPVRLTASVGIASASADMPGHSADHLMAQADIALQAARARGGNRSLTFDSELYSGNGRRMELEQELRAVLDGDSARAGAFRLVYQPCVALSGRQSGSLSNTAGQVVPPLRGFEALLRWQHPRLGDISPGEFIGIAEGCGLIEAIGDWVMQRAVEQIVEWRAVAGVLPYPIWRVAVNVSALQLSRPGFAAEVMALLTARDLPVDCLTIEVTEGVFADERAAAVVAEMRQAGLKIAVDDFGIGYSSLSYLRRLPADELKLDRCFLQRDDGGSVHEDLLGALVKLARSVGLSVLAEGVETEEQFAAVAAAGCDAAQGWLFARALPPEEAAQWIAGARDITMTEKALPRVPFSFRDIVEAANEAVIVTDGDLDAPGPAITYVNPAFTRMTGWKLADVLGKSPRILHGADTDKNVLSALGRTLQEGRSAHARVMHYARSGMPYWCEMRASPLRDQHGRVTHFVTIARDVTHEMRRLDDLEAMVERDRLTSIANRRGLERFAATLPAQSDLPLCVAYVDVDDFKQVNSSFGQAGGNALLLGIADLISENLRRADFVGRLGGDEFVICMPSVLPSDARMVSERLLRIIANRTFEIPAGPIRVTCSVGLAVMEPAESGLEEAIARARVALSKAKAVGRGSMAVDWPDEPSGRAVLSSPA